MFPISGAIYFFGSIIFLFLGLRFLHLYKKENNRIAKFFGYGFLLIGFQRLFLSIPALLLIENQKVWSIFEIMAKACVISGVAMIGYIMYCMKVPNHAKKIAIIFSLILVAVIVSAILYPSSYYFKNGVLYWEPSLLPNILAFLFGFAAVLPGSIFLLIDSKKAETREAKMRGIGLSFATILFLVSGIIDTFLANINQIYSDINFAIGALFLLAILILTYRPLKEGKS